MKSKEFRKEIADTLSKAEEAANYMEQYILEIEHDEIRENKKDEEYEF